MSIYYVIYKKYKYYHYYLIFLSKMTYYRDIRINAEKSEMLPLNVAPKSNLTILKQFSP